MKKIFLRIIEIVSIVVFVASCAKEMSTSDVVVKEEQNYDGFIMTVSTPDAGTKTVIEESGEDYLIKWQDGDKIGVYEVADGEVQNKTTSSALDFDSGDPSVSTSGTATFTLSFGGTPSGPYDYSFVYPSSALDKSGAKYRIHLNKNQTFAANSFDPNADILLSEHIHSDSERPATVEHLRFARIGATARMVIKAPSTSETIQRITFSTTEGNLSGYYELTPGDGTVTNDIYFGEKEVILTPATTTTWSGDNIVVWFRCGAITLSDNFTVTVRTNAKTYTKVIDLAGGPRTLEFAQGKLTKFTVNMTGVSGEANTTIENGNYVIAAKNSDTYYAISSAQNASSERRDRSVITTEGFNPADYTTVSPYTAANSIIWTVTNVVGGVKINLAGDTNRYMKYGSNTLPLDSTGSIFEVSNGSASGTYNLFSTSYIYMNSSNGFGCYANAQTTKDLYLIPATGTPTLTFPVTSKVVDAESTSVVFNYTAVFLNDGPFVSVTSDEGNAVVDTEIAAGTLTVTLNENTTTSDKSITLRVSATGVTPVVLTITQAGAVGDASNGDTLWAEAFSGFGDKVAPSAGNEKTTVYGSKSVTYACVNGGSTTQVYGNENLAGGAKPELLVSKSGGSFTVSGIPTGNATGMTLSFKANNGNIVVSTSTQSATIGSNIGTANAPVYGITVPGGTKTLSLTFSNAQNGNTRIDDLSVVAGAPVPGITVSTASATATATATGTTATLNGSLTLVNGAVNANVTEAGFYYKLSSAGSYSKVTCAAAPTSTTTFSYDLTGLTKDSEYTYYAYAVYDDGDEVIGSTTTFTPTQSGGASSTITLTYENFTNTSYNVTENTFTESSISFGYVNAMRNGSNGTPSGWAKNQVIQTKNTSTIYNKTSLNKISKIRVYTVANTNSFTVTSGSTTNPTTNSVTRPSTPTGSVGIKYSSYANKVVTDNQDTTANYYDFDIDDQPYFQIAPGGSLYIYRIEITYSN
jgi:hypothetical protein